MTGRLNYESALTFPWEESEMISFRGHLLAYTLSGNGNCIVRFPGGGKVELQELVRRHGAAVKPPKVWRKRSSKNDAM
jgi:hypothetical protein